MKPEYLNRIFNEDCLVGLKGMPAESVDCCVTSTPYWGLRDYGYDNQIGLDATPDLFVQRITDVFDEVKRVLKPEGTLWLNIGDSYASASKNRTGPQSVAKSTLRGGMRHQKQILIQQNKIVQGLKPKDLVGIPWMVAFSLRSTGWFLRQDIVWHKPNPMPESVTDRCTRAHEYIFLLSKNKKYHYDADAIKQVAKNPEDDLRRINSAKPEHKSMPGEKVNGLRPRSSGNKRNQPVNKINKRSVWVVNNKGYSEAHFATFPEGLIVDCIKAGCPEEGIVLDPFMGSGTTACVARKLNRNFVGFELNPDYIKIAEDRIFNELGIFA